MTAPSTECPFSELLPAYLTQTLEPTRSSEIASHLTGCPACQQELAGWTSLQRGVLATTTLPAMPPALLLNVRSQIAADNALIAESAARRVHLTFLWQVMRGQLRLMRGTIWLAAAVTFAIGLVVALLLATPSASALALAFFAPIIGAFSIAFIYEPENDPALELALATPTSPRLVLLARLTFVYGYDLALALLATAALAFMRDGLSLWPLITLWLFPMFFLSGFTLLLAMLFNVTTAAATSMTLWTVGLMSLANRQGGITPAHLLDLMASNTSQQLFMLLGVALFALAFAITGMPDRLERFARIGDR